MLLLYLHFFILKQHVKELIKMLLILPFFKQKMILQVNSEKQIKNGSFRLAPIQLKKPKITANFKKHTVNIKIKKLKMGAINVTKNII